MQKINKTISISTAKGEHFFIPDEIIRLEASGSYTNIFFTNKRKILTSQVLNGFVLKLEPFGFLRTHRKHLVNRQHISFVDTNGVIFMKDESVAALSRRRRTMVMKVLKNQ